MCFVAMNELALSGQDAYTGPGLRRYRERFDRHGNRQDGRQLKESDVTRNRQEQIDLD